MSESAIRNAPTSIRIPPGTPDDQIKKDERVSALPPRDDSAIARDPRTEAQRDRDRILYSAAFRRLGGVTQIITPPGYAPTLHNRLTHSIKVAQIAKSLAGLLIADSSNHEAIAALGGLDADVCEAAALAHDLGHPPFGHIGETVLDEYARDYLDLRDGFEGNAQTMRIVTTGLQRNPRSQGLDLTLGSIAAIAKYPWIRSLAPEFKWRKFSFYSIQAGLLERCRSFAPGYPSDTQSLEASIMDLADDIAYAIHDLEDFFMSGLVVPQRVIETLEGYSKWREMDARDPSQESEATSSQLVPSVLSEELAEQVKPLVDLARELAVKYDGRFDEDEFLGAVRAAAEDLKVLAEPLLNIAPSRASATRFEITSRWVGDCINKDVVVFSREPLWAGGPHISLNSAEWHRVQVLKWVTKAHVIANPDIALLQRGQEAVLRQLIEMLNQWLEDDVDRLPPRLLEEVLIARRQADGSQSSGYAAGSEAPRGEEKRAIIDYLCTLSDHQCIALNARLTGQIPHNAGIMERF